MVHVNVVIIELVGLGFLEVINTTKVFISFYLYLYLYLYLYFCLFYLSFP
jgi:hypothetical protein